MAKRLFISDNFIIAYDDVSEKLDIVSRSQSSYNEENDNFVAKDNITRDDIIIPIADAATWLDAEAGGDPYSEASMRTFFRQNASFKPAPGGRGAPNTIVSVNSANLKNLVAVVANLLPAPGVGNYYSDIFIRFKFNAGGEGYAIAMDSLLTIKMGVIEKMITTELITSSENAVIEISDFFFDKNNADEERPFANPLIMNQAMTLGMIGLNDFINGDGTLDVELWYTAESF